MSWNPRRRTRRYRRNSAVLPLSWNPGLGGLRNVFGRVMRFTQPRFLMNQAAPAALGYGLSGVAGKTVYDYVGVRVTGLLGTMGPKADPFVRIACNALGGSLVSWIAGKVPMAAVKRMAGGLFMGTVVRVGVELARTLLDQFAPGMSARIGLSGYGLGNDTNSMMQRAVRERLARELGVGAYLNMRDMGVATMQGVGTYMNQGDMARGTVGEFVNDQQLRNRLNYAGSPRADLRDYDVTNTDTVL